MHQNKITICLGATDENRTRLSRIDNPLPSQRTTVAYWYRVRGSNPSLQLEGLSAYPEAPTRYNLVPPTRIELVMTGYQPIVIPFNYRGIIGGCGWS